MAVNRFWVGGTGNIDGADTTHWAATTGGAGGASYPGPTDSVFFDGNSGGGTVTVTVAPTWLNFDSTGYTGTYNGNSLFTTLVGTSCTFGSTMTAAASFAWGFNPVAGATLTLNTNGKLISSFSQNGSGTGTVVLASALSVNNVHNHSQGVFDTASFTWTLLSYTSNNSNTRSLTMGSSSITITGTGTVWDTNTISGFGVTANTATITMTGSSANFNSGGKNFNGLSLAYTGSGTASFSGSGTVANLTRTGTAVKTDALTFAGSLPVVTGALTINGNSTTNRVLVQSSVVGTARTVSAGSTSMSNVDLMDITAAGAASWNLSAITGGSGDAGGNSGITFTAATTRYAVVAGNWSSTATWSTTTGGAGGASVPLPQDAVVLDVSSAAGTYTVDMPRIGKDITCTGFTRTLSLSIGTSLYGSLTLSSGMTFSGTGSINFAGRSTHTITSAGRAITSNFLSVAAPGGSYTLADALNMTGTGNLAVANGIFDTANFSLTAPAFNSNSGVTRSVTLGTSTVSLTSTAAGTPWNFAATGLTLSAASSTIILSTASSNSRTFTSGGATLTYGTLTYTVAASTGALSIGNSTVLGTLNVSGGTRSLTIAATTTLTATNWNVFGLVGAVVTVQSGTAGSAATISKASGFAAFDYVSVQDVTGTGGATFYMGSRSTNVSGNTGLSFTDAPQRFWVVGTATWDATVGTKWAVVSGGTGGLAVPTNVDDVYFDANSGAVTVTAAGGGTNNAKTLIFTGFTGTMSGGTITVSGTLTMSSAMSTLNMSVNVSAPTSGTATITSAGKTFLNVGVNTGAGGTGTLSLTDALTMTGTLTFTAGTFQTSNFAVTCSIFSSSNTNTRVLTLGSSSVTVTGTGSAWLVNTTTGLTVTSSTSTITLTGSGASFQNGSTGGGTKNYNNLTFSGGGAMALTVGSAVMNLNNLIVTGTAVKTDSFQVTSAGGVTVTGTLALSGNSTINRLLVKTAVVGTAVTLTSAANSMSNVDLMDITAAGAANWNLSAITGGSGDAGGNSGITFTTGVINYWVGGTGNWSDINHWASTSGGVGGTGRVPLPQGTARFDSNSFTAGAQTVTIDMPRVGKDIDWTGATNSPTWVNPSTGTASFFGSLTLTSNMSWTSAANALSPAGRGSHTITMAGRTWANTCSIVAPGGTYTLLDAFICGVNLNVTNGTLDTNSMSVTCATFGSTGSATRALLLGTSVVSLTSTAPAAVWNIISTGLTISAASATIVLSTATTSTRQFTAGGFTYGTITYTVAASTGALQLSNVGVYGTLNVSGGTRTLLLSTPGQTVTNWNVFGTAGNLVTVASFTPGTPAPLTKGDSILSGSDYLSITDIAASPGSTWYAGTHSTDGGGNTGWVFTDPPITGTASLSLVATGAARAPVTGTAALSLVAATATAKAAVTGTAAISLVATDTSVVQSVSGTAAVSLVAATATAKAATSGTAQVTLTAVSTGATAALAGSAVLTLVAARVVSVGARDVQVEFSVVYDKYVTGTPELYTLTTGTPSI